MTHWSECIEYSTETFGKKRVNYKVPASLGYGIKHFYAKALLATIEIDRTAGRSIDIYDNIDISKTLESFVDEIEFYKKYGSLKYDFYFVAMDTNTLAIAVNSHFEKDIFKIQIREIFNNENGNASFNSLDRNSIQHFLRRNNIIEKEDVVVFDFLIEDQYVMH